MTRKTIVVWIVAFGCICDRVNHCVARDGNQTDSPLVEVFVSRNNESVHETYVTNQVLELTWANSLTQEGRYEDATILYRRWFSHDDYTLSKDELKIMVVAVRSYVHLLVLANQEKATVSVYEMARRIMGRIVSSQDPSYCDILEGEGLVLLQLAEMSEGVERKTYIHQIENIVTTSGRTQGRMLVVMARLQALKGDVTNSISLLDNYLRQLKEMDICLYETRESDLTCLCPVAECLYTIADILTKESGRRSVEKVDILSETEVKYQKRAYEYFRQVAMKHPLSRWSLLAEHRAKQLKTVLESK